MAQKTAKNKTGTMILGAVAIVLVIIGLVSVVRFGIGTVRNLTSDEKLKAEYETYLAPVIMNDPKAFDDVTRADQSELISISIWSYLKGIQPDDLEYVDEGMLVPKEEVEKTFISLFSTDVKPTHMTVDGGEGLEFVYDETRSAYIIPITGITPTYTPDVVDISKKGTTVILTVGYLAGTEWEQSADGSMVAPTPAKYMKISLRETADDVYYISAIQSAVAVDYVTQTQEQVSETTDDTTAAADTTSKAASTAK